MNQQFTDLEELLQKSEKSIEDKEQIYVQIKTLKYFNPFIEQFLKGTNKEVILELCSKFVFQRFDGGTLLFEEGEKSNDKLYIIWSGSVILLRQRPLDVLQQDDNYIQKSEQCIDKIQKKEKEELIKRYGFVFRELEKGDGFGEKALIEQVKRTLTAAINSNQAELLVLHKIDFMIVSKALEQSILDKKNLIFTIFQVNEYSKVRMESMIYSFQSEELKKKKYICMEEQQGDKFYIIQQGEVMVTKKNIPISILGRGSIFGEEIVQDKYYNFSVMVKSLTATIMVISYYHFHSKFPQECKDIVVSIYRKRKQQREKILEMQIQKIEQEKQNNLKKQKNQVLKQFQRFFDIDQRFDDTYSCFRTFVSFKQKTQFINSNLNVPRVKNYSIHEIIQNESSIRSPSSRNQFHQQFDFGRGEIHDLERKKQMYQKAKKVKKNNYIKSSENLKAELIKEQFLKKIRPKKRQASLPQIKEDDFSPKESIFFQTSIKSRTIKFNSQHKF